jgi:hypothetical protein
MATHFRSPAAASDRIRARRPHLPRAALIEIRLLQPDHAPSDARLSRERAILSIFARLQAGHPGYLHLGAPRPWSAQPFNLAHR